MKKTIISLSFCALFALNFVIGFTSEVSTTDTDITLELQSVEANAEPNYVHCFNWFGLCPLPGRVGPTLAY